MRNALVVGVLACVLAFPNRGPVSEQERIQAHLTRVERTLLARDVAHLSASQRRARSTLIAWLREYRVRGMFPRNTDFPGERVPYFVDRFDTRCAMAYLIERSGRGDIVAHVAATRNNAYVPALADEPGLAAWLDSVGFTVEEAAAVQPAYGDPITIVPPGPTPAYAATSLAAMSVAMLSGVAGSGSSARWPNFVGLASGTTGVILGATAVDRGNTRAFGVLNLAWGALATYLNARSVLRPRRPEGDAGTPVVSLAPILSPGSSPRIGVTFRTSF
jgi:hypothetical protein